MTNGERTTILPGEKTPILPEVMEASYPGDPDLWSENPVARARRGLKGHSSYKAALGTFPLENEDNILCTMSWVEWPKDDYVPFNITLDQSRRLTLTIYLSGGSAIATVTGTNWSGFTYIRLNMVGNQKLNVTIKDLTINGSLLGQYSSKGGNRTWFFRNKDKRNIPFSSIDISGKLLFSEAAAKKFFHQSPRFDFIFGC